MPWDPLRDVRSWQERLGRLAHPHPESWSPAIDVYETAEAYVITAEVPGLPRDQVELSVEDSRLAIRGHRRDPGTATGPILHFHHVERGHGSFTRTFEFAETIDVERVSADLANGVLCVTVPKRAPAPPRRIEVK